MTTPIRGPGIFKTISGRSINIANPNPEDISIGDITIALSYTCRFGGHLDVFYSVAQHSCLVHDWLIQTSSPRFGPKGILLAALAHDFAEAFVGDMISPLKALLPEFKYYELAWTRAVEKRLGLSVDLCEDIMVRQADVDLYHAEDRDLRGSRSQAAQDSHVPIIEPWHASRARRELMHRLEQYGVRA